MNRRNRPIHASATALAYAGALTLLPGCATQTSYTAHSGPGPIGDLGFELPVLERTTAVEREAALERGENDDETLKTPAVFWTGITVGTVGTIGLAGFGLAGQINEGRIRDGFDEGIAHDDYETFRDRGELYNKIAVVSSIAAVFGFAIAAISYGIDYSQCGPLSAKKRKCK